MTAPQSTSMPACLATCPTCGSPATRCDERLDESNVVTGQYLCSRDHAWLAKWSPADPLSCLDCFVESRYCRHSPMVGA